MVEQAMQRPDDFGAGYKFIGQLSHEALSFDQGIEFTLQILGRNKRALPS
jgi:hypothetical protein